MRTKNFYLCLLLLVLGTAKVWADKYYQPWDYRYTAPRYSSLSAMIGEKFMIYNATFDGVADLTGFLYDNGTTVALDKTKERDRFVYNEKFVYILEEYGTADDGAYAFKSVGSGTYVAADGSTGHAAPQPIYIKDWETAGTSGWARAGVRCENKDFQGVENKNITNDNCQVFLLSSSPTHVAGNIYWNGEVAGFKCSTNGLPFAFYKVSEVQSGAYLQDLHIFSRSDIYSAQVIWGYVKTADDITGAAETSLLIDGDLATSVTATNYLQFDLGEAASSIYVYLQRSSANGAVIPSNIKIQASANGTDGWVTIDGNSDDANVESFATNLGSNISYTSDEIALGGSYQHIRVVNASGEALALSEAYILPTDKRVDDAVVYFNELSKADNKIYTRATAQQYTDLVNYYNTECPEVKALSGVPLPGNKYRIYADAYDIENQVYVNKEIYWTGEDANGDNILTMSVAAQGSYYGTEEGTDARKAYEWYCEETSDGYLVFRNVANTGLYLANDGTVSATAYKWSFSTVQTHHFGVPMWDGQGKYLAVANDGVDGNSGWVPGVAAAQDQVNSANYAYQTAGADTPDDTSDDVSVTVEKGVCTDFVFIPVDVTATEKKITFTANEITKRNSSFVFDGVTYTLPYSRIFTSEAELNKVTCTLQCPEIHPYDGTYVNNKDDADDTGKVRHADGVLTFDYSKITDGDVLDIRLTFKPFEPCNDGSNLYLIQSVTTANIIQQAPGMRKADIEIGDNGEDGPIQTAGADVYYAKFAGRDEKMLLTPASKNAAATTFDAKSLFYFQPTEGVANIEYYSVSIRSAITPFMCASADKWTEAGDTWYVQPNATASSLQGYAISQDVLNATNNPANAWCVDNTDGETIKLSNVENDGAAWMFVPVSEADAKTMLKKYIATTGAEVQTDIEAMKNEPGIDNDKATKYTDYVQDIIDDSQDDAITVAKLVDLSQKVHMLDHEIVFALKQLPDATYKGDIGEAKDYDYPHWYYIYNVRSKYAADGTTEQDEYYAKFVGKDAHMALEQVTDADADGKKDFSLDNMFYFEGRKVTEGEGTYNTIAGNALTIDEYLQVDIHNFVVPDTTLVSKNEPLIEPITGNPGEGERFVVDAGKINLEHKDTWRIECEYNFPVDNFKSYNTYGSCLLATTSTGADGYYGDFQVYLKDDRSVVVKFNNKYDTYRTYITQDYFSTIKIVITHSPALTTFDIINSQGTKATFEFDNDPNTDIPSNEFTAFTELRSMLPDINVTIKILTIEEVKAHNWKVQDTTAGDGRDVDTAAEEDTWYILPSSNTKYPGFSIVANGANDTNFGWTNVKAENEEIFSDAGNANNSTWQFVRIEEFDDLVDELLDKYSTDECVIYNEKLSAIFKLIKRNASFIKAATVGNPINGKTDEDFFNEIYEVIKNYDGPMPDELKAPKPGKFYTMRPACDDSDTRLYASQLNWIVQKPESINDAGEYDSSGVWLFEGTEAADGFYELDGIMLKSLHTQSYTDAFAADKVVLNDASEAAVTINPVGGCVVRFQGTDDNYLRRNAVGDTIMVGNADIIGNSHASLVFTRTGTAANTVSATVHNEFNEVMTADDSDVTGTLTSVSVESNVAFMETKEKITDAILCPNRNGSAIDTDGDIVLTFTYNNLPAEFESFNNIGLDIHALNSLSKYQYNTQYDVSRKFNVAVEVGTDVNNLVSFGSLTETEIAAGVGSSDSVHKVWNVANDNAVKIENNSVVVRLTISSTDALCAGCFFGLSNIILSTEGDTWYIEEMPDGYETKIYHKTKTNSVGLSSLMLGYPAKIPTGIKLFYPITNNDLSDKFITLRSYDGTIAASTPAVMHADAGKESETFKFYYSTEEPDDDSDKATATGDHIVIDGGLYQKAVAIPPYETEMGVADSKVYMYVTTKTAKKFYWVKENYNADGTKSENDFNGYIRTNANRAFLVIGSDVAGKASSFSLRFDDGIVTGILDIDEDCGNADDANGIFDLQGRKLDEISAPGIYIVNGKKVIVK